MNLGAFMLKAGLLSPEEVENASALAQALSHGRSNVHSTGRYAGLRWFQVALDPDTPVCRKVLTELGISAPELLVFYYLEPGATIHPHRDLTGAGLNNRIRFHVPIITNSGVKFRVSGERVTMKPGDLWCLDTSYLHSVENGGSETRVHLVIECAITPELRARLPKGLRPVIHNLAFASVMAGKFAQSVLVNSVTDRAYFRAQMRMVWRFVGWRVLKIGRAA